MEIISLVPANGIKKDSSNGYATDFQSTPLSDEVKIKLISNHFKEIMQILGLNLADDSLVDTPERVAKMYVKEIFSGLNPVNKPKITLFENKYAYNKPVIEKNIALYSYCEHHFVPITGNVHIGYIPAGKLIGLSKLNRIVQYCSSKPQVQEKLTEEIAVYLKDVLKTEHVAVLIDAVHLCVASRGIKDLNSTTLTTHFSGKFVNEELKNEFFLSIK